MKRRVDQASRAVAKRGHDELDQRMDATMFMDGTGITPGTERCRCSMLCEFPCWQRLGLTSACAACGCPDFTSHTRP